MTQTMIWMVVGFVLVISEFFVPGLVLLFFGLAALLVSIMTFLGVTENFYSQLLCFGAASALMIVLLRRMLKETFVGLSQKGDSKDVEDEFTGKEVKLLSALSPDEEGKVEFKGAVWAARSSLRLESGDRALIKERKGLVLIIGKRT